MELLISAIVTLLAQTYKWLASKIGLDNAKKWTLLVVFILTVVGVAGWKTFEGEIVWTDAESIVSTFGIAIAYYEVIIKRFFIPLFNKFS